MRTALALAALGLLPRAGLGHEGADASLRGLDRAVGEHPGDAELRFRRAELHRVDGDLARARDDYAMARRLDPTLAVVELGLARALLAGDPEGALRAATGYLACVPASAEGHRIRGSALEALGRRAEAAAAWERVLDLAIPPREPEPDDYLERARLLAGGGDTDLALRCLEAGLGRLGGVVAIEAAALDLEIASGRSGAALARLDALARRSVRKEPWKVRQAELYELLGLRADARRAFEEARASLHAVPAARRAAPATQRLERQIEAGIARLDTSLPESHP